MLPNWLDFNNDGLSTRESCSLSRNWSANYSSDSFFCFRTSYFGENEKVPLSFDDCFIPEDTSLSNSQTVDFGLRVQESAPPVNQNHVPEILPVNKSPSPIVEGQRGKKRRARAAPDPAKLVLQNWQKKQKKAEVKKAKVQAKKAKELAKEAERKAKREAKIEAKAKAKAERKEQRASRSEIPRSKPKTKKKLVTDPKVSDMVTSTRNATLLYPWSSNNKEPQPRGSPVSLVPLKDLTVGKQPDRQMEIQILPLGEKNSKFRPSQPCLGCGCSTYPFSDTKILPPHKYACVLREINRTAAPTPSPTPDLVPTPSSTPDPKQNVSSPLEVWGHLCVKCYKLSKSYTFLIRDNTLSFTPLSTIQNEKYQVNRMLYPNMGIRNPFYVPRSDRSHQLQLLMPGEALKIPSLTNKKKQKRTEKTEKEEDEEKNEDKDEFELIYPDPNVRAFPVFGPRVINTGKAIACSHNFSSYGGPHAEVFSRSFLSTFPNPYAQPTSFNCCITPPPLISGAHISVYARFSYEPNTIILKNGQLCSTKYIPTGGEILVKYDPEVLLNRLRCIVCPIWKMKNLGMEEVLKYFPPDPSKLLLSCVYTYLLYNLPPNSGTWLFDPPVLQPAEFQDTASMIQAICARHPLHADEIRTLFPLPTN